MKKIYYLILAAGLMLTGASCQKTDEKRINVSSGGLVVTADIIGGNASRVSYGFENDSPTNALKAIWEAEDQIFGFDDKGGKFAYKVKNVTDGRAEFELSEGSVSEGATTLYAVYYPDKGISDIKGESSKDSIYVDLSLKNGVLNTDAPAIMAAAGEIKDGTVHLSFRNQTAIVGIYKFQLPDISSQTEVDGISLNGVFTKGVITLDGNTFKLVPDKNSRGTISASNLELMSDVEGNVEVDATAGNDKAPYFAVIPGESRISVNAVTADGITYGVGDIPTKELFAGAYYYLGKTLEQPARINDTYYSLRAAFANAKAGETIVLEKDCTSDGILALGAESGSTAENPVTFDLNGHTIMVGQQKRIQLNDKMHLVIEDSQMDGTRSGNGGIICFDSGDDAIQIHKGSSLVFNSGIIQGGDYAILNDGGNLTINDGTFSGGSISAVVRTQTQGAKTVINGGRFTSTAGTYVLYCTNDNDLTVRGGTFTTEGPTAVVRYGSWPNIVINNGQFNNNGTGTAILTEISPNEGTGSFLVSGGRFKTKFNEAYLAENAEFIEDDDYWKVQKPNEASIGGQEYSTVREAFKVAKGGDVIKLLSDCNTTGNKPELTKGKSTADNPVVLDLQGHTLNLDGEYRIDLSDGMHLKITDSSDGDAGSIIETGSGYHVIALNGTSNDTDSPTLVIEKVNISGGACAVRNVRGILTLESGTFSGSGSSGVISTEFQPAKTTINGGIFTSTNEKNVLYCEGTVYLNVNGGEFATSGATVLERNEKYPYVTVTAGKFTNNGTDNKIFSLTGEDTGNTDRLKVSGGQFFAKIEDTWFADGYGLSEEKVDGYYTVIVTDPVAKIGDTPYATIDKAFEAAMAGQTITLKRNCSPEGRLALKPDAGTAPDNRITLDLNGCELSWTSSTRIELSDGQHMEIKDGKNDGGAIKVKGNPTTKPDMFKMSAGSSLLFTSGKIYGGAFAINNQGGSLTIEDGEFSSESSTAILNDRGTLLIKGGTFSSGASNGVIRTQRTDGSATTTTTIQGGTFRSTNSKYVLYCYNTVTLNVANGTDPESVPLFETGGETVVYDNNSTYVTVNISGGKFKNNNKAKILSLTTATDKGGDRKHVTGGKFSVKTVDQIDHGYDISDSPDEDGYYTVEKVPDDAVMRVGNDYKTSVSEALEAANSANSNVTVKVLKNIDLDEVLAFNNTNDDVIITLNLNSCIVNAPTLPANKTKDTCAVSVLSGHLVICDNSADKSGELVQKGTTYDCSALCMYGGTLDIESGTIRHSSSGYGKSAINVRATGITGSAASTINMNGGKVSGGRAIILRSGVKAKPATLNIRGGLIEGTTTSTSHYSPINFQSTQGFVNMTGGTVKANGSEAIYLASNSCTVSLLGGFLYTAGTNVIGRNADRTENKFSELNFYSNKGSALNVQLPEPENVSIQDGYGNSYTYKFGNPQTSVN